MGMWLMTPEVHHAAVMMSRGFFVDGMEPEDIAQEALLAAWLADRRWKPGLANRKTFANLCVSARLKNLVRDSLRERRDSRLRAPLELAVDTADVRAADTVEHRSELHDCLRLLDGFTATERSALGRQMFGLPVASKTEDNARQRAMRKLRATA